MQIEEPGLAGLGALPAIARDATVDDADQILGALTLPLRGERRQLPADHGLAAALASLLGTVKRPTTLKAAGLPRFPARVEAGVYFCLATLLRAWPSGEAPVLISVSVRNGRLCVILFDPEASDISHIATPTGWELIADRIAASGGMLTSSPNFGGLIITIDVPTTDPE